MPTQIGYIDSDNHPRLTIKIIGTGSSIEADALIDTGFTGFLMLPMIQALPLGLVLKGVASYTLADGSKKPMLLAEGTVVVRPPSQSSGGSAPPGPLAITLQEESILGVVTLGGDEPIVGMEFLRALDKWLLVGRTVALFDHASFPPPPSPTPPTPAPRPATPKRRPIKKPKRKGKL
jgi:hypothetical protein